MLPMTTDKFYTTFKDETYLMGSKIEQQLRAYTVYAGNWQASNSYFVLPVPLHLTLSWYRHLS